MYRVWIVEFAMTVSGRVTSMHALSGEIITGFARPTYLRGRDVDVIIFVACITIMSFTGCLCYQQGRIDADRDNSKRNHPSNYRGRYER